MGIYDVHGNVIQSGQSSSINCKIIAHRGYHAIAKQNTIAAFKAASDAGFKWIEIDIRKCADGIYVMSHDDSVTLYNNGTAMSVRISTSNYSNIKSYTWDSAGKYNLCTLQAVFNSMKLLDMHMICDKKSGTNTDIMNIASMCGAVDRVMLSYGSFAAALDDVELLKKYDNVPIRVYPIGYLNYLLLKDEISNPIYADYNATGDFGALATALACEIPIIFSGCTKTNFNIWSVLANGCMANLNLNITYEEFYNYLNNNYDRPTTITPSVQSVSVSVNSTAMVTASSDLSSAGGYVYGYTLNPNVATVVQNAFGQNVSFTITGIATGSTTLRLFDGCGEIVNIPVTVS